MKKRGSILLLLVGFVSCAGGREGRYEGGDWERVEGLSSRLPAGLSVWHLDEPDFPLRAWCVRADLTRAGIAAELLLADDDDRRETVTQLADESGVCVAVNAGFFAYEEPARHVGWLCVDGQELEPPKERDGSIPTDDAVLAFDAQGRPRIEWIGLRDGVVFAWPITVTKLRDNPPEVVEPWTPALALQGGARLISRGRRIDYSEEENRPRHPRTAAGITESGELVLVVVDGRQRRSRGADLAELTTILIELGCVDGVNLDGGGSSALVVLGRLVNQPAGGRRQRAVANAIGIRCGTGD